MPMEQKSRRQGVDVRGGITVWATEESRAEGDVVIPAEQREDPRLRCGGNVPPPTLSLRTEVTAHLCLKILHVYTLH